MTDNIQSSTTPPISPRRTFVSPKSPKSPRSLHHTFPHVSSSAPGANNPRHQTRHVPAADEFPLPPATLDLEYAQGKRTTKKVLLEFADGSSFTGFSFGAVKSVSGELVFQTGNNYFKFDWNCY